MQVLDVPMHYKPMSYSVSIKGVTQLKQGIFKRRHSGAKEIIQQPGKGFTTIAAYKRAYPQEFTRPTRPRRRQPAAADPASPPPPPARPKRVKEYVIDKKQVSHRILNYVNKMSGEKMLYLWTVSFPLKTPDTTAHRLLNRWLTRLRQEKLLRDYLWIAERQQNGTIHFHIAINQRLEVKKANRFMRAAIMRAIDSGELQWTREDASKYNGVDISKNRKTRRATNFAKKKNQKALSHYLTKYISKSQDKFQHLAWHNSRGYSNLIINFNLTAEEFEALFLEPNLDPEKPLESEFFIFKRWKGEPPEQVIKYLQYVNQVITQTIESSN